jgi:hypothetical protein
MSTTHAPLPLLAVRRTLARLLSAFDPPAGVDLRVELTRPPTPAPAPGLVHPQGLES